MPRAGRNLSAVRHVSAHFIKGGGEEDQSGFNVQEEFEELIEDEPDPKARKMLEESVGFMYRSGESGEIEVEFLLQYLETRQRQYMLCSRLPFTVAIFAVFVNMVLWHEDLASQGLLQRFIRSMVEGSTFEGVEITSGHKDFNDIQSKEDIYTFLREALLPNFLPEDPVEVLRGGSSAELHRALRYNRLIGGVQLQQRRLGTRPCTERYNGFETTQAVVAGSTCFARTGVDDCFGPLAFGVRVPNLREFLPSGFCGDSSSEGYGQLFYAPPAEDVGVGSNTSNDTRRLWASHVLPRGWGLKALRDGATEGGGAVPSRRPRRPLPRRRAGREGEQESEGRRLRVATNKRKARAVTRRNPHTNPSIIHLESDTYSVMFTEEAGLPGALGKLDWLQDNEWIDLQTQWVGINIFMLNPELSVYLHVKANIYGGTSGEWVPHVTVNTFHAEPYQNMSTIAIDAIFLVLVMSALCISWGYMGSALVKARLKVLLKTPYHWVRMAVAHGGLGLAALWVIGYERLTIVKDRAAEVSQWLMRALAAEQARLDSAGQVTPEPNISQALLSNSSVAEGMKMMNLGDRPEYVGLLLDMHREVQAFSEFVGLYRVGIAVYGVLLFINFFRLFQMQPRLAMVVNTLLHAWKDVLHHLIVFVMLWMAFTVSGMLIFGRTVFAFGNFREAINKTFTIMLGDMDWEEISVDNPTLAAAWLWIFLSMMMLLMLNMLMAIVMDVYAQVKSQATEVEPIWSQLNSMLKDWMQDRDEIGPRALERILKRLAKREEVKKISAKLLAHVVPGMKKEQAVTLVSGALQMQEICSGSTMTLTQMHQMIGHVRRQVDVILNKTTTLEMDMRAQVQENRELAKRRRAEAERRAEELSRIQAEDRWEHSRRFCRRATAIEDKVARAERLVQDAVAWLGYRGRQVDEDVAKIERLARAQAAQRPSGARESAGGRVLATLLGVPSSSGGSSGGLRARLGGGGGAGTGRIAQEPPRLSPASTPPVSPGGNKMKAEQPPTETQGFAPLFLPPPSPTASSSSSRQPGRSSSAPPKSPSTGSLPPRPASFGSVRPPVDLENDEDMPVPRLRTTGHRLERIDSGELLESKFVKSARGSRKPAPTSTEPGDFSV